MTPRFHLGISCACVLVCVGLATARAAHAEPGDDLDIAVLTFGPGDHPFSKFGHIALLVDDRGSDTQLVYNYGTFAFDSAWLIPKFLMGKYHYWLSVDRLDRTLATYAAQNRSVVATHLQLSGAAKRDLVRFLAWNARDENKYYVFDYYRDNCATRVRDLVDKATAGALRAAARAPAELTWRAHTQRLTSDALWVYAGLYVTMGPLIDQPITQWEEMFLPEKVEESLIRAGVVAERGTTPLLSADRTPPPTSAPHWSRPIAVVSAFIAALVAAVGFGAGHGVKATRAALGIGATAVGALAGGLGVLFLFLWGFTNHAVAYRNENILQCSPVALWLAVEGYRYACGREHNVERLRWAALAVWASAMLGCLLKVTPLARQDNVEVLALLLPLWSGLALASHLARPRGLPANDSRALTEPRPSRP